MKFHLMNYYTIQIYRGQYHGEIRMYNNVILLLFTALSELYAQKL